jgi:hypothetical protein
MIKEVNHISPVRGGTLYCVIRRTSDGYIMESTSGSFKNNPADKFNIMTENSVIPGMYYFSEESTVWNDDEYQILIYVQIAASPNLANDSIDSVGYMQVVDDEEVDGVKAAIQPELDYINAMAAIWGLIIGTPAFTSKTQRTVGTISQDIVLAGDRIIVRRTS